MSASAPRVAINGFGRIGRSFLRTALRRSSKVDIVAVNDTNDPATLAYLLEYDTVQRQLADPVKIVDGALCVDRYTAIVSSETDPARLPWGALDVDVVLESTGRFTMAPDAARHVAAGARRVIISAPASGADLTVCIGVNDDRYDPARHVVLSNASCTTNCLAVMVAVLQERFGIVDGFMSTVHAYTNDQNLLDLPYRGHTRDLRRSRAAAENIVPSTTGAARAIGQVLPELEGRLDGIAFRVPVTCGSVVDFVCTLEQKADPSAINAAFAEAAATSRFSNVLSVTNVPLVSTDIVGRSESCVFSSYDTMVHADRLKVLGWYDNEWGYANRLLDLVELIGERS